MTLGITMIEDVILGECHLCIYVVCCIFSYKPNTCMSFMLCRIFCVQLKLSFGYAECCTHHCYDECRYAVCHSLSVVLIEIIVYAVCSLS